MKFEADANEANNIVVFRSTAIGTNDLHFIEIIDSGASITAYWGFLADWGCENVTPNHVRCRYPYKGAIGFADAVLGDGDDRIAISTPVTAFVNGGGGGDRLLGGAGRDTLVGGSLGDVLVGGGECDRLFGEGGNDLLTGGSGADLFDGGADNDAADYRQHSQGVSVSLNGPVGAGTSCAGAPLTGADDGANGGTEGDNVLVTVENVWGTDYSDSLTGSALGNMLAGGDERDWLQGGGGSDWLRGADGPDQLVGDQGPDRLDGGEGVDEANYEGSQTPVRVILDDVANDGPDSGNEGDNVASDIERILGGWEDDVLLGSGADNWLDGGYGDDHLNGGAGADVLVGSYGGDELHAEDGWTRDTVACGTDPVDEVYDRVAADVTVSGSWVDSVNGDCDSISWFQVPDPLTVHEEVTIEPVTLP